MRRILLLVMIAFAPLAQADVKPSVRADREDAIYHVGEVVSFQIEVMDEGKAVVGREVEYVISKDGIGEISKGKVTTGAKPQAAEAKLGEPGFLRCVVTMRGGEKPVTAFGGAAIDPEQIKPSLPVPEDFDSFWKQQKQLLIDEPAKPVLTKVDSKDSSIETFDVQINCPGGAPVSAYLARQIGAKPKSLPAILYPHSAGVRSSDLPHAIRGAKLGAIALDLNAHGIPNGKPDSFYTDLSNTTLKSYPGIGATDREKIYFRGMILRLLRAVDFLASQPEWDGKVFIVSGSSQGGGQALIAAGLDERVTLCLASVPALCDHSGAVVNRIAGWPKIVPRGADGKPNVQAIEAARYVDAMNFATRIKCPVVVSVGFTDHVSPPTSVYAAYNNITSSKKIVNRPTMWHAFPPEVQKIFEDIAVEHIAASKKK